MTHIVCVWYNPLVLYIYIHIYIYSIQSAGDLVSETLMGSNPAFSRGRQLVSFRLEYRLPVPEHRN